MRGMWGRLWHYLKGGGSMWENFVNSIELHNFVKEDQRRKGVSPEIRKQRLIQAIRDYWGDDLRYATRDERRRFARELADLIANNITAK